MKLHMNKRIKEKRIMWNFIAKLESPNKINNKRIFIIFAMEYICNKKKMMWDDRFENVFCIY